MKIRQWGSSIFRNLEVKSLHKKQENLTTENTEITEIFSKVFSVDSACTAPQAHVCALWLNPFWYRLVRVREGELALPSVASGVLRDLPDKRGGSRNAKNYTEGIFRVILVQSILSRSYYNNEGICSGCLATFTPAASSAFTLPAAVPEPPSMMAPA